MYSRKLIHSGILLIMMVTAACNLTPATLPTDAPTQAISPVIPVTASTQTPTAEVVVVETPPIPTDTAAPTVTPDLGVTITASTGSLSIRRGPGTAYNRLGYLQDAQSAVATARDLERYMAVYPHPLRTVLIRLGIHRDFVQHCHG